MDKPEISVHHKIWFCVEKEGASIPLLGEMKIELLKEIQSTGSINDAAKNLDLDYHKAWDMVERANEKVQPYQLVHSKKGRNGGTELTPLSLLLLEEYDRINTSITKKINLLEKDL